MTISQVNQFVRALTGQVTEELLPSVLLNEIIAQSVISLQDIFIDYCLDSSYKTIYGTGYRISFPADAKDAYISQYVVKAGKGEVFDQSIVTSSTGVIRFIGREPKSMLWTVTFNDSAVNNSVNVDEFSNTIEINYNSTETEIEGIPSRNSHIVTLLNANLTFLRYFYSATTTKPNENILEGLPELELEDGEGVGWRQCYYLPQAEEGNITFNTLSKPKANVNMYYQVVKDLNSTKIIEIIPPVTHYNIEYIAKVDTSSIEAELNFPQELFAILTTDVAIKVYQKLLGINLPENLRAEYNTALKQQKGFYESYIKQLSAGVASRTPSFKTV